MATPESKPLGYEPRARAHTAGRMRRALLLFLLAFIAVAILGFFGLWLLRSVATFGTDTALSKPAEIEKWGQCKLPASASNVRAHLQSWQDYRVQVRFDMKPAELPAFLASTGIKQPLSTSAGAIDAFFLPPPRQSTPWWVPGQPTVFETGDGEVTTPGGGTIYQRILIDETNPAMWTVWFVAFDT